ncbi:rod-binding protein [Roseibium limicola]|uniref:Rod-binding protein n=1 Tax=Roseibium limicola TaxID=2816037 RepID=A0A939ELV1_9HYPH|nr:rod-binding protein [Roseibium limicola]MBO0344981.1 rod-binding protein [Roseibium limicola]
MVDTATTLTGQYGLNTASAALSRASISSEKTDVREAAEEFESVFLRTMLQNMFTGLDEGGTWGKGHGSEAWQGMLIEEYAKNISQAGGVGLADSVERQLLQMQESAQ